LYNIEVTFNNNFQWDILSGNHFIVTDLPQEEGGEGEGPHPAELFLSSIGAAAGISVSEFLKDNEFCTPEDVKIYVYGLKKELPIRIEDISIRVEFSDKFPPNLKKTLLEEVENNMISNTLLIAPLITVEEVL